LDYDYGSTNNNGNLLSHTLTVPTIGTVTGFTATQTYAYDSLNRLSIASENNGASWQQNFDYDRYGNRKLISGTSMPSVLNAENNPMIKPANNRIDTALTGQTNILYDDSGNLTREQSGRTYQYDGNKLVSFDGGASNGGASYSYDGDGRRVKKLVGGSTQNTTVFVYDITGQLIAEYTDSAASGTGTSYVTSDTLGSPRVITGSNQNVKGRHDYLPFGEQLFAGSSGRTSQQNYNADNLRQQFTSKERDIETGLDYFGARYYASRQGRFTSADPLMGSAHVSDPQSWNRYTYVNNNPLRNIDPEGLDKTPVFQDYNDIYGEQQRILENSSITVGKGKDAQTLSGQALYDYLAKSDPKALANFLNQTTALMNFQVMLKDGGGNPVFTNGAALVNSVTAFKQDRIIANVDPLLKDAVEIASITPKGFAGLYEGPENSSLLHGEHDYSFRQNLAEGSQQISFASKQGFRSADIDIDPYNPYAGRAVQHGLDVMKNRIFRTKTEPYQVYGMLLKNPNIGIKPNYEMRDVK
jgi:RHS repeat-associated protein